MKLLLPTLLAFLLLAPTALTAQAQWTLYKSGGVGGGGRVFVSGDRGLIQGSGPRVWLTADDGGTWAEVSPAWGTASELRDAIAFGGHLYFYSSGGTNSFVRTTDVADEVEVVPGLIRSGSDSHGLNTLLTDGEVIWIRTFNEVDIPHGRIFISEDGENWTHITDPESRGHYLFYQGKLYSLVGGNTWTVSEDYGANWEDVATFDFTNLRAIHASSDRLFAHDRRESQLQALLASADDGMNWTELRTFASTNITVVPFGGHKVAVFYVEGGKQRISISDDHGSTWDDFDGPIFGSGYVYDNYMYLSAGGFQSKSVQRRPLGELGVNIETTVELPSDGVTLYPAYPNPFRTSSTITYDLPQSGHVEVRLFDLRGREVAVLRQGMEAAGRGEIDVDGANMPAGMYLVRLSLDGRTTTRSLLLVR